MYNHNNYIYKNTNTYKNNNNLDDYNNLNYNILIKGSWGDNCENDNEKKKTYSKFRTSYSFKDRLDESTRILLKYPERIPIICEKGLDKCNPNIDKNKYLVPLDLTVGNFVLIIRKRIKLQDYEALFLMINGSIPSISSNFKELYHRYKDIDGYLYMTYAKENVFG